MGVEAADERSAAAASTFEAWRRGKAAAERAVKAKEAAKAARLARAAKDKEEAKLRDAAAVCALSPAVAAPRGGRGFRCSGRGRMQRRGTSGRHRPNKSAERSERSGESRKRRSKRSGQGLKFFSIELKSCSGIYRDAEVIFRTWKRNKDEEILERVRHIRLKQKKKEKSAKVESRTKEEVGCPASVLQPTPTLPLSACFGGLRPVARAERPLEARANARAKHC